MDNKKIGDRIRKIRQSKNLSQENLADELKITKGAVSKIERGDTDANVSRLLEIAKILEVNISDFFEDNTVGKFMENRPPYGFASKEEVENLHKDMQTLLKEFEKLKEEIILQKTSTKKKRKK